MYYLLRKCVGQVAASKPCEVTQAGNLVRILLQLWQLGQGAGSSFDENVIWECMNWSVIGNGIQI